MTRKNHTAAQIARKLREAEADLAQGQTTADVARKLGVTEQTYHSWRKEYGGLRLEQTRRLRELEKVNAHLKRLVAEHTIGNPMLERLAS